MLPKDATDKKDRYAKLSFLGEGQVSAAAPDAGQTKGSQL